MKIDKPVLLVAHSMGAVTMSAILEELAQRDPEMFNDEEKLKLLKIRLIAPAGFFDFGRRSLEFIKRVQKFSASQANADVKGFSARDESEWLTANKFLESMAIFPVPGVDTNQLAQFIQEPVSASSDLESIPEVKFNPQGGFRQPELTEEDAKQLQNLDYLISQIFNKGATVTDNISVRNTLLELSKRRFALLNRYMRTAYDGVPPVTPARTEKQKTLTLLINSLVSVPTVLDMVRGSTLKTFNKLKDKADIGIIIPGNDVIMPLADYEKMELTEYVKVIMKGYTHAVWVTGGSQVKDGDMEQTLRTALQ